jgi:tRNA/tmRNA/rRNA uracil-C5-methylase (TrmA/RlmC/RlmD family)
MSTSIEVRIESLAYGGDGIGRIDGRAIFVPRTAPGDLVRVRITEDRKSYLRGEVVDLVEAGPNRRDAPCRYFGTCGGCQLQHVVYPAQVEAKAGFVRDALTRIGRIDLPHPVPIHNDPSSEFGYRLRATAHAVRTRRGTIFGFYASRSHRVVDIDACPLLVAPLDDAWRTARRSVTASGIVDLAAGDERVSVSPASEAGSGSTLEIDVGGFRYLFAADVFFQANRFMLETLVSRAVDGLGGDLAVDLFAGVGLFTLPLARGFERVVAVESDPHAIRFARDNAQRNGVANLDLRVSSVESWLEASDHAPGAIGTLLLDPPRGGVGQEGAAKIARLAPETIVYVSCDPATLARDLRVLLDNGYALREVEALDLFPQTVHVETIARLDRTD